MNTIQNLNNTNNSQISIKKFVSYGIGFFALTIFALFIGFQIGSRDVGVIDHATASPADVDSALLPMSKGGLGNNTGLAESALNLNSVQGSQSDRGNKLWFIADDSWNTTNYNEFFPEGAQTGDSVIIAAKSGYLFQYTITDFAGKKANGIVLWNKTEMFKWVINGSTDNSYKMYDTETTHW
jgi:hypothetical protein